MGCSSISYSNRLEVEFHAVQRLPFLHSPFVAPVGRTYLWHGVFFSFMLSKMYVYGGSGDFGEVWRHLEKVHEISRPSYQSIKGLNE